MLNVFSDFHHAGLLNSLILLFEGRLGGNVYRPIGMEWAEQGYWAIYDHPATQLQYLTLDQGFRPVDGTPPLNQIINRTINRAIYQLGQDFDALLYGDEREIYYCQDIDSGKYNKAITLKSFFNTPIDIVIASVPQHIEPFKRLCEAHPNKPKLIYQIGNAWNIPEGSVVNNVMASAKVPNVPEGINFVEYHQEFDLGTFKFYDSGIIPDRNIYSFVNCFNVSDYFQEDWKLFLQTEQQLLNYSFKAYGGQCRDGAAHGTQQVADKMNEARFIWHTKNGGDGYGHVVFNTGAVGRPMLVKKQYYQGKMAEKLMVDGETCIAIDGLTPEEIANKVKYYSEPDRYIQLSRNVYRNFTEKVSFDRDAENIRAFLANLK